MTAIKDLLRSIWRALRALQSAVGTLIFLIFLIVVLNLLFLDGKPEVKQGSALTLDIRGFVVEQKRPRDPYAILLGADDGLPREVEMRDIVRAVSAAKGDDRISTLVLRLEGMVGAGPSQLHEIGSLIDDFKTSGKPVLAFGNYFSQAQYLIASHADKIYMNPGGFILLSGYGIFPTYFKAGLDMLKAKVHVFRVGEYKTAGEPFLRNDMSPEAQEANRALLEDLWQAYLNEVAANRQISAEELADRVEDQDVILREEGGSFAKLGLKMGLVDELVTPDGWLAIMRKRVGRNGIRRGYKSIKLLDYIQALGPAPLQSANIGIVVVNGLITDGERPRGTAGGETIARQLRKARKEDRIKAVVLRVDSPGGSALASEQIRREVALIRRSGKPVIVSMGVAAASGGYWVSLAADEIWASETTITGSIGIVAIIPTFESTLGEIGINIDGVGTTKFSGGLSPFRELSEPIKEIINQSVHEGYRQFVAHVAQSRGLTYEAVDAVARGRVWSGKAARELGLIDKLGGLESAIASAAAKAELSDFNIKYIEDPSTFEDNLAEFLEEGSVGGREYRPEAANPLGRLFLTLRRDVETLLKLDDPANIYALCLVCRISW